MAPNRKLTTAEEAQEAIQRLGYTRREMPADGNCLFRACAEICLEDQAKHGDLRQRVVDHMIKNREAFEPFIETDSFDEYIEKMGKDGTWGSDIELQAIADLHNTSFSVLGYNRTPVTIGPKDEDSGQEPQYAALWFAHAGHFDILYTNTQMDLRRGMSTVNDDLDAWKKTNKPAARSRKPPARLLTEEQKRRPTIKHLLDQGFSEAELAQQFNSKLLTKATRASMQLDDAQKRRPTIQALLEAGFTERELLEQLANEEKQAASQDPAASTAGTTLAPLHEGKGVVDETEKAPPRRGLFGKSKPTTEGTGGRKNGIFASKKSAAK